MDRTTLLKRRIGNVVQSIVLIGGMVLVLVALIWLTLGPEAIVWAFLGAGLGLVFSPRLSPRFMLRLYGARELSRRAAPDLYALVEALAHAAELPAVPRLYYIPSTTMNAFTLGNPKDAVLAVTDGLLRRLSGRELAGVLAHEIAHVRHNDLWIMTLADHVSRLTQFLAWFGIVLLLFNLPLVMMGYAAVPWAAVLILILSPTLSALLQLALSRTREYDADLGATELTGDPEGLASALVKLEREQGRMWENVLMPGRRVPDPSLLRTHPPNDERVKRLLALRPRRPAVSLPRVGDDAVPAGWPAVRRGPSWHWSGIWR